MRAAVTVPTPVWPNLPSSSAFVPLVFLVASIAAGFFAWSNSGLSETQAAWGVAGLQVLWPELRSLEPRYGLESPLYAWSIAAAVQLPVGSMFWRLSLPAFIYFLLSLLLLYRITRRWYSPGSGLVACFIFGVNHELLAGLRSNGPGICTLFTTLLLIWCYLRHERTEERFSIWLVACAGAVTLLVLGGGLFAGWVAALAALMFLFVELHRRQDWKASLLRALRSETLWSGLVVAAVGFALASPWMLASRGGDVLTSTPPAGVGAVVLALPAAIILAAFGFWNSAMRSIRGGPETASSALLAIWTLLGGLALESSSGEYAVPFAVVPLSVLAGRTFLAVLHRKLPDRQIFALCMTTLSVYIVVQSPVAAEFCHWLLGRASFTAEQALRLHFTIDVLVLSLVIAAAGYTLSARRDRYRRQFVGAFAVFVLAGTCLSVFRHFDSLSEAGEIWRKTYESLYPYREKTRVILVGDKAVPLPLEFVTRSLFPRARIVRVDTLAGVDEKVAAPLSESLVLVCYPSPQLPTSTPVGQGETQSVLTRVFANEVVAAYAESLVDAQSLTAPRLAPQPDATVTVSAGAP